jgi:hypothetical protein
MQEKIKSYITCVLSIFGMAMANTSGYEAVEGSNGLLFV